MSPLQPCFIMTATSTIDHAPVVTGRPAVARILIRAGGTEGNRPRFRGGSAAVRVAQSYGGEHAVRTVIRLPQPSCLADSGRAAVRADDGADRLRRAARLRLCVDLGASLRRRRILPLRPDDGRPRRGAHLTGTDRYVG